MQDVRMGTGQKETYKRDERHAPHEDFHQSVDYFAKNNGREKDKHRKVGPKEGLTSLTPSRGHVGQGCKGGPPSGG